MSNKKKTIIKDAFPSYYNEVDAQLIEQQYIECIKSFAERYKYNPNQTYTVVYEETYNASINKLLKGDENTDL